MAGANRGAACRLGGNHRGGDVARRQTSGLLGVKEPAFLNKFRQTPVRRLGSRRPGVGWVGVGAEGAPVLGANGAGRLRPEDRFARGGVGLGLVVGKQLALPRRVGRPGAAGARGPAKRLRKALLKQLEQLEQLEQLDQLIAAQIAADDTLRQPSEWLDEVKAGLFSRRFDAGQAPTERVAPRGEGDRPGDRVDAPRRNTRTGHAQRQRGRRPERRRARQLRPLPHRGLCGPLSPTSAAFLRAVTKVVRHSGPHSPLCGSESGDAPSAQSTVRVRVRRHPFRTGDCADPFRRHPRPAPLVRLGRQSPDQREVPPHPTPGVESPCFSHWTRATLPPPSEFSLKFCFLRVTCTFTVSVFHPEQLPRPH